MSLDRFFMEIVVSRTPEHWQNGSKIIREIYMTMMQHILLRLPAGDRTLKSYAAAWGDKWWERAEHIGYLQDCPWGSPGVGDGGSKEAALDWGAFAYEMSLDEIREMLPPQPILDGLDPAGRYAVVWMECY